MIGLRQSGLLRWSVGIAIFAAGATLPALHLAMFQGRPWALLAGAGLLAAAAAAVVRRQTYAASAVIFTSMFLQLGYIGVGYSDQVDLGRMGLERVLDGQSPYGVIYENRAGGSNPFGYGPLALVTSLGGVPLELLCSALLLATIAWTRSWLTLCIVAGFPPYIFLAPTGVNDYSVGLLLTLGWLAVATKPVAGVVMIAAAASIKPYVAAWFPAVIGHLGWTAAAWLIAASVGLWWPVLIWDIGSYVESLRLIASAPAPPGWSSNTIPIPWVRVLGLPVAVAGLLARHWSVAIVVGSLAFSMVLFFGQWASLGYWVALLPITGIALERLVVDRWAALRTTASGTSGLSTGAGTP